MKEVTKVRTLNPLVICVVKRDTLLTYAGVGRLSKTNPRTSVIVTTATSKDTRHKTIEPKP